MNTHNLENEPSSTAQTAADEARKTKDTAVQAGAHLATTAQDEVRHVAAEAGAQVQDVVGEFMSNLHEQADLQQQKVAEGLRALGNDLQSMADSTEGEGESALAGRWVREAASRASGAADWLEQRDAGSLVHEVKRFARRRPAAFLGIAVGAGLLAGRLTRGLSGGAGSNGQGSIPPTPKAAPTPPIVSGFGQPLGSPATYGTAGTGVGAAPGVGAGAATTIPPAFPAETSEYGYDPAIREPGFDPTISDPGFDPAIGEPRIGEPRYPDRGTGAGSHD